LFVSLESCTTVLVLISLLVVKNTKQDLPLDMSRVTLAAPKSILVLEYAGLGDPVPLCVWVVLRLVRAKPS
jgi:hypothetical protein